MTATLLAHPFAPVDAATRREFITLLGTAGLLTACGGDSGGDAGPAGPGFPRDVAHVLGTTRIERRPERIVCVSDGAELATLLALGVAPVGFGQRNDPLRPWIRGAEAYRDDIDRVDIAFSTINWEQYAAWRPDVILGQEGFLAEGGFDTASAIAPTVATNSQDWRESLRQVSEAVGLETQAAELRGEVEARVAAAVERARPFRDRSIVVIYPAIESGYLSVYDPGDNPGQVIESLGLRTYPRTERGYVQVSAERVSEIDAEAALIYDPGPDGLAAFERFRAAGLLRAMPAEAAGNVVVLSPDESNSLKFASVATEAENHELVARLLTETLG